MTKSSTTNHTTPARPQSPANTEAKKAASPTGDADVRELFERGQKLVRGAASAEPAVGGGRALKLKLLSEQGHCLGYFAEFMESADEGALDLLGSVLSECRDMDVTAEALIGWMRHFADEYEAAEQTAVQELPAEEPTAALSKQADAVALKPTLEPAEPETPVWVEYTPDEDSFNLTMFDGGGGSMQEIDISREEYVGLKCHVAAWRGYACGTAAERVTELIEEMEATDSEIDDDESNVARYLEVARELYLLCPEAVVCKGDAFDAALKELAR